MPRKASGSVPPLPDLAQRMLELSAEVVEIRSDLSESFAQRVELRPQ